MELILIRHGLPLRVENAPGAPADPALSDVGHVQAERMAQWLRNERIDRLYSSPLRRARETAKPLGAALGLAIELEPDAAEFDQHSASYIPMEHLKEADFERWQRLMRGEMEADFDEFAQRVIAALDRIVVDNPGRRVAVTCHGGVINVWAAHVIGLAPRFFFNPDYTSINRFIGARSGERSVITLNEAVHLRDVQG
ncbi:MAG TPA: histidine phosphatase family protein [Gammaproteobacteria bacterium]|jgi:probable phosphoglycerate mutase|nr:histidine phosphatase family protein [Gammaproteobacteria bacterium]